MRVARQRLIFSRLFIFHTTSRDIERERWTDLFGAVPLNIKPARLPTVLFCCPYTFAVIPAAQPMRIDPDTFCIFLYFEPWL